MITIGEAVNRLEAFTFVGRERELAIFKEWLTRETSIPEILNVSGHGGIGKSALLRVFARIAQEMSRPVIFADSRDFPHTPEGFLHALSGEGANDLRWINDTRPLILLDTFEELGELTRYLRDDFFPHLSTDIKVVVAGRYPLGRVWTEGSVWQKVIRYLPLSHFSADMSRKYLLGRGLRESDLIDQVVTAAGGSPLALSLAADMTQQLGIKDFSSSPEWHLIVRSLVERLLDEVKDPDLRSLLESCAVIREFDEDILSAVSTRENIGDAFHRLSSLSAVRASKHGLVLHDELRQALAEDLRWRRPDYFNLLRLRGLEYYRKRSRTAPAGEQEWLLTERILLAMNGFTQQVFLAQEGAPIWVETVRPDDHENIRQIWDHALTTTYGAEIEFEGAPEREKEFLEMLLSYAGTITRVARDQDGNTLGFYSVLPVCQEALPILLHHPGHAAVINACLQTQELTELPVTHKESNIYYTVCPAQIGSMVEAVRSAMLRDSLAFFHISGIHIFATPLPLLKTLIETSGFEPLPAARTWTFGPKHPMEGYMLNLSKIGIDRWIEAIVRGRKPLPWPDEEQLDQVLQGVLVHWENDKWLARSMLCQLVIGSINGTDAELSRELRTVVKRVFWETQRDSSPKQQEAYRMLEATYFQPSDSPEHIARQFAVSRATYFRMLKRGIRGLAEALQKA